MNLKNSRKNIFNTLTLAAAILAAIGLTIWDSMPGGIPEGLQCLILLGGFGIGIGAWLTAGD